MLPVRPQRELPCNSVGGSGVRQGLVIPALPANHSQPLVASALALSRCDRNSYILTISLSEDKVKAIKAWKPPKPDASPAAVRKWAQEFLAFANFYRRFIDGFSKIALPLSDLTKQDRREWSPACEQAFETL